jgi:hypothetical protein
MAVCFWPGFTIATAHVMRAEDFARNQLQRSGGVRDSRIGFTHVGDLYGK